MDKNFPNFPLLFEQIGNCLGKGNAASPQEREVAIQAFNTIWYTIYDQHEGALKPCTGLPVVPQPGGQR